jgi:hypothetical protein
MATSNRSDEIDLLELFAKSILIVRRNTKIIIIAFILGTLLGLAYYQLIPKSYSSRMIVVSDILTESYSKTVFDNLGQLISERNIPTLASKLKLKESQAAQILGITVKGAVEKADGLKEQDKTYLTVEAQSGDNAIWPDLQNGILHFLQHNEFVSVRVEQRKKYYGDLIKVMDKELDDLEDLKTKIGEGKLTQGNKENLLLFDPTEINSKIVEINKEKLSFVNSLELANSVQLVEGFTVYEKPSNPKLSISLAAGISFGLLFVMLVISFKGIRSMVRFSEEKLGEA